MEDLKALVDLISKQKINQANIIDELENPNSKIANFYIGIKDGLIYDNDSALQTLYGGAKDNESVKKLKNRLFNRLINSIFFIDQTSALYNDSLTAAKNCYKNFAAIRLLIGNRKRGVGINLALKTLKISRKYDFTDLNYLLTSLLTNHYISIAYDKSKYLKFKKLKKYYQKALVAENNIEEMQGVFNMDLSKSSSGLKEEEINYHHENILRIKKKQKKIQTYRYNLFAYLYQINFLLESRKYKEISILVIEGLSFFDDKGVDSMDVEFFLKLRAAIAQFMLKNHKSAENYFKELISISNKYSVNWYSVNSYLISLYINIPQLHLTYDVLSQTLNAPNFEKTHPLLVQQFKIKEAYIHFLVELGKIDPSKSEEKPLRKFRLNRFLNDVPTYSKDKRGVNISILIIQMLLLVQNKKHGEILDKLDALNMYSHRYLRSDNTFRSNCFIKMLAKLPDADYHPVRWERYVKKFRDRLDEHPFELSYHNLDLEVIPFETLYNLVVEMLEKQKR